MNDKVSLIVGTIVGIGTVSVGIYNEELGYWSRQDSLKFAGIALVIFFVVALIFSSNDEHDSLQNTYSDSRGEDKITGKQLFYFVAGISMLGLGVLLLFYNEKLDEYFSEWQTAYFKNSPEISILFSSSVIIFCFFWALREAINADDFESKLAAYGVLAVMAFALVGLGYIFLEEYAQKIKETLPFLVFI